MVVRKKIRVMVVLLAAGALSIAAINPQKKTDGFKNLKVLPKDISAKELQKIMVDDFQDGLGVSCNFCHSQEPGSLHLDYAADTKPEKEIARSMMQMTMDINQKYFGAEHPQVGDSVLTVNCNTCHQGTPHPEKN